MELAVTACLQLFLEFLHMLFPLSLKTFRGCCVRGIDEETFSQSTEVKEPKC
jgi:hypothetical protein